MSDISKRGPDCDDDCEDGERGERGKRGKRGQRGHHGHDGDTGLTGPTGPTGSTGGTGPQGPTGSSAGEGLAAYGYAVNSNEQTVAADEAVRFAQGGLVFPNVGIIPPAPNGTTFTILSDGDYEYIFYAIGQHALAITFPMQFAIFVNGINQGVGHEFSGNRGDNVNDMQIIRGQGIIHLLAGQLVTLVNRTANGTVAVVLIQSFGIPPETNNATLSLKKLSP